MRDIITTHDTQELDVLVFPELLSVAEEMLFEDKVWLQSQINNETVLIDSKVTAKGEETVLEAYSATLQTSEVIPVYEKQFLMPMGEYIPQIVADTFKILSLHELFDSARAQVSEHHAGSVQETMTIAGVSTEVRFCSEILSPSLYQVNKSNRPALMINLASHSFFGSNPLLLAQLKDVAKVRAVENHAYYLQATNGSPALAINPRGQVIGSSETPEGILVVTLRH